MPHEPKHPLGWITFSISEAREVEARAMRAERDERYDNIFDEHTTDEHWVGELGELVFDHWLKLHKIRAEWITSDAAGRPDFILEGGAKVGVKTVKRQVPPRADYTAQVTARHAAEDVDHFAFMSYEIEKRRMWLLGGMAREPFKDHARYYAAGERVHPNYQIRPGHEIYNIALNRLIAPDMWLRSVTGSSEA